MISCYFAIPGVGKSTILAKIGQKELKKKRYEHIYTINIEISGCEHIDYDYLRKYKPYNSLILIDEITLEADNRNFKNFTKEERDFFTLHRHLGCDIIYTTQYYKNVDSKIRDNTQDLWYLQKSILPFLRRFTIAKKIYRTITINEFTSELTNGYRFCNTMEMIFDHTAKLTYRPKWYKYYDSWDELTLKDRPSMPIIEKTPYKKNRKVLKIWKKLKNYKTKKKQKKTLLQHYY